MFKFDFELILRKTVEIAIVIGASVIIYYIVVFLVKRLFSLSFKKLHIKEPELIKRRKKTLEKVILSVFRYLMYFMAFLVILSRIGVNTQTILTGAGFLGVIFAVGSQNLLKDFIEGFFNIFENNISVGDYVEIDGVQGHVIDIGLRTVKVKSYTGEIHIVPNSKIGHIVNFSLDNGKALVDVLVDYNTDISNALDIINRILKDIKKENHNIIGEPTILGVTNLKTIGYEIRIMCTTIKETHWQVERYIRSELLKAFKKENLQIGINQIKITEKKDPV